MPGTLPFAVDLFVTFGAFLFVKTLTLLGSSRAFGETRTIRSDINIPARYHVVRRRGTEAIVADSARIMLWTKTNRFFFNISEITKRGSRRANLRWLGLLYRSLISVIELGHRMITATGG